MKMKRILTTGVLAAALLSVAACGSTDSKPVVKVLNLKPEIDQALQDYAKLYSEKNDVTIEVETCGGSNCDYASKLDQYIQADQTPDIFLMEGRGGFDKNKDLVLDLSKEKWTSDTDYAFMNDGKAYGFPLGVEGFGLTYNKDILDKAGIDPATLTSYAAYEEAFKTLESKKEELGISAPVAMATGSGMYWVGGLHGFNSYLSGGLKIGDTTNLDKLNKGEVDATRMSNYGDMMNLLFANADASVLTAAGDQYADQVKLFTDKKTAFIHQGNWIDGDLKEAGLKNVGIAPAAFGEDNNVYISAPSYFFVHKDGKNTAEAKKFLASIQSTKEGQDFMYKKAASISPFKSVKVTPEAPLAKSVYEQIQAGKGSPWNQNDMPSDFGMQKLGPVHEAFAKKEITKDEFVAQLTKLIEALKK